jgi:hypothetical protein
LSEQNDKWLSNAFRGCCSERGLGPPTTLSTSSQRYTTSTVDILRPSPLHAKGSVKRRAVRAIRRYVRLDERGRRGHGTADTYGPWVMHGSAFPRRVKRATRVPLSKQSSGRRSRSHSCDRDRSPRSGALRRMRRSPRRTRELAQILAALCAVAAMVAVAGAMGEALSVTPPRAFRSAAPQRQAASQRDGGGLSRVAVRHWFQDE